MFNILLYLYDTYLFAERFPEPAKLARKLSAVGFESTEITQALRWLSALDKLTPAEHDDTQSETQASIRIYNKQEIERLATEGRGFLTFLETSGYLAPHAREWIIERALALNEPEVSGDRIKWIALLALWKLKGVKDVLWLEDLVRGDFSDDEDLNSIDREYDEDGNETHSHANGWQPTYH
jgi:Smg protein